MADATYDAIVIGGLSIGEFLRDFNKGIIDTSKNYSLMNAIAESSREIYNAVEADKNGKNIYDFDLNDMYNEKEKKAKKEKAARNEVEYEPANYFDELMKLENMVEELWIKREEYFANDIKVDQMPGANSMHESKAKYVEKKFVDELSLRIERRTDINKKSMLSNKMIKTLLRLDKTKRTETEKIEYSLDIIKSMTKVLNGEC